MNNKYINKVIKPDSTLTIMKSKVERSFKLGRIDVNETLQALDDIEHLEKGKRAQVGEIREWKGQKHQKQGDGSWKPVTEGKGDKKQEESGSKATGLKVGSTVKIPRNLTTDPKKKQGEVGEIISMDGDIASVKFSDGEVGKYTVDALEKQEGDSESKSYSKKELKDFAKNTSTDDLEQAARGEDPQLRVAANEELQRREKEEKYIFDDEDLDIPDDDTVSEQGEIEYIDDEGIPDDDTVSEQGEIEYIDDEGIPDDDTVSERGEIVTEAGKVSDIQSYIELEGYTDKEIAMTIESLDDAEGFEVYMPKNKKRPPFRNPEEQTNFIASRVKEMSNDIADGNWPERLEREDVENILWGAVENWLNTH